MNELYALDPAAPADWRELKLLLDQFGLETGRFVARYPQDWTEQLKQVLGGAGPVERARVEALLRRRRSCVLPPAVPARYEPARNWPQNAAVAAEADRAFTQVIGQRGNGYRWPTPDEVLYDEDQALPPGRGAHLPMQSGAYAACVRPLLLVSPEVTLVDPYFTTRDRNGQRCRRHWPVLTALLRAAQATRTCQTLRLLLSRGHVHETVGDDGRLEQDLDAALDEAAASRVGVTYELRDELGHGRYLLGLQGGLQFDRGFEVLRAGETNHVHWLSAPELGPLQQRFLPGTVLQRR